MYILVYIYDWKNKLEGVLYSLQCIYRQKDLSNYKS